MTSSRWIDRTVGVALAISAMLLSAVAARRAWGPPEARRPEQPAPVYHADWARTVPAGHREGPADAAVTLVEFGDFECPYCRAFATSLHAVQRRHPNMVAVVWIHYPLTMHRFAVPAARAAECAARQGRFAAYHDALFTKQDSLGLKSWASYGVDASIADTAVLARCAAGSEVPSAVRAGLTAGEALGVRGTPTLLINGWLFWGAMDSTRLDSVVVAAETHLRGAGK